MNKRIDLKIIAFIAVLAIIMGINCFVSVRALSYSKDSFNDMTEVYLQIDQHNTSLVEHTLYAKIYMNDMMGATDAGTLSTAVRNTTENANALLVVLEELDVLCEKSEEDELISAFTVYSDTIKELMDTVMSMIDSNDTSESFKANAVNVVTAYATVDELQGAFTETLLDVTDEMTSERIKEIESSEEVMLVMIVVFFGSCVLVLMFVNLTISGPTKRATKKLQKILKKIEDGEGDLTERIKTKSKDEIGQLVSGINNFLDKLQTIMQTIQRESNNMNEAVVNITEGIRQSNDSAGDVSAAMEELSASMEEVSATLSQISTGANECMGNSKDMRDQARNGAEFVQEIKTRAEGIKAETVESKENARVLVQENRAVLEKAIKNSKNVEKINELTEEILSISQQTNLLALNASIEAARAGEAGKGFAVVADEIRILADDSRATANNIQEISNIVTRAVSELAESANSTSRFIDETVMSDYDKFVDVAVQYDDDADSMDAMLKQFYISAQELEEVITNMSGGISEINDAVDESANGINSSADNINQLVEALGDIADEAETNKEISELLKEEVDKFKNI